MSAAALPPPRRPRTRHDTVPSFVLAVLMHVALFAGISLVVRWNTGDPGPVMVDLWSVQPPVEVAPPPPPPPPKVEEKPEPPKPEADIVLKQERRLEEKKAPPKKEEPKKDLLAELLKKQEAREREKLRQAEAERILAQMAADRPTAATQPAASGTARDAEYRERLAALIRSRIVYAVPEGTSPSVYADVQVELLPSGEVVAIKVLKPSGLPGYDEAVERAIRRTDPFPRKPDGTVDRTIVIRFRPVDTPR